EELPNARLHLRRGQPLHDLLLHFFVTGLAGLPAVFDAKNQEAVGDLDRVGNEPLLLFKDDLGNLGAKRGAVERRQLTSLARRDGVVGVVARQFVELLPPLGPRRQVLGLLFGLGNLLRRFAFGGDQDLPQKNLLFPDELALVLLVVL